MIYIFSAASFLFMLALEGIFIRLLFSRRKAEREVNDARLLNEQERKELYAAPAREFAEPFASVTDQTTNRLEPIYRDEKSKQT